MRSLLTFGVIAAFIGMAFTTPSEAVVSARETSAKMQISSSAAQALFSGSPVSADEMRKAAKLMEAMATDPKVASYAGTLSASVGVKQPVDLLGRTAKLLANAAPTPKAVVKRVVTVAQPTVPRSREWKNTLFNEKDPYLKSAFESIDWAQRKSDIRLCSDFDPSTSTERVSGPTTGDLLALCLAKVSGDPARCGQIDSATAPVLKRVCETELVT